MNLVIDFNPAEEVRLEAAAKQIGLAPAEYVKKLVAEHLPVSMDSVPEDSTLALFAQWDQEDAQMTAEEIAQENRTWEDFKININSERERANSRKVF